ncbi:MAG: cell division protein FtsK [Planctomycetaceae bacterium]|nr:cell division protein FtsK [Planctomycetaceae bacterium]
MNDSSLVEQYAGLLNQLQATIDRRLEHEAALNAIVNADNRPFPQQLEEQKRRISEDFDDRLQTVYEQKTNELNELEGSYNSETSRIESEHQQRIRQLTADYKQQESQTGEEYQQKSWMMSSIVDDDAEESPKRKLENLIHRQQKVRMEMGVEIDHLEDLNVRAKELVEKRRHGITEPPAAEIPKTTTAGEAHDLFLESEEQCRATFETLRKQKFAYWFSGGRLLLQMLLLAGFLGGGLILFVDRESLGFSSIDQNVWFALMGGAGALISVLTALICWDLSRRQTADAYENFVSRLYETRAAMNRWEAISERERAKQQDIYDKQYRQLVEHRERSIEQFEEERDTRIQTLEEKHRQSLKAADEKHDADLAPILQQFEADKETLKSRYAEKIDSLKKKKESALSAAQQDYDRRVQERDEQLAAAQNVLTQGWIAGLNEATRLCRDIEEQTGQPPEWDTIASDDWTPPDEIPENLPLGMFGTMLGFFEQGQATQEFLPPHNSDWTTSAALPFPERPSFLINYDGAEGRAAAESLLQVAMLRLLTSISPGNVRFTVLDPVGLGEPFSSFMHLADDNELLITNRIWTEPNQIDKQLADLTEHMENIFQTYLRNQFASIEEYNEHAGEVAEPYRILVVSGFPQSFSERAAQRLASIASSGPRCGVYLLLSRDTGRNLPRDFELDSIVDNATVFDWRDDHFETSSFGHPPLLLSPDEPPAAAQFSAIVKKIGKLSTTMKKVEVPFYRIAPNEDEFWKSDSRDGIDIPLGRAGATRLQHLRLGQGTSQHVLIAGRTGSGKSTLLHIMITNAALCYSPDELEFYLIDFKKGVEFKTYASHQLPHARVIAIESDREFGLSALRKLDQVMKERGDIFREVGVQDIAGWRNKHPDQKMPRIILMIDEFQEFFVEDDRIAQDATLLLDRLVRQGRAFGIHILLGSQTLGGAYSLARTTLSQMGVRIALQCSESDAHLILSEENTAARLLTRPGEAIYNDANGMMEGNSPFQIAWLEDSERETQLDRIQQATQRQRQSDASFADHECVVFEGNVLAEPALNASLVSQIRGETEPSAPLQLWLGDPVTIGKPASLTFSSQPGQNLLIVGTEGDDVSGLLAVSLFNQRSHADDDLPGGFLLDGGTLTSERWRETVTRAQSHLKVGTPNDVESFLEEITTEMELRRCDDERAAIPLFLTIVDLTKFGVLRKSEDDFGFGSFDKEKEVSPSARFQDILKEGPTLGIHVMMWCHSYNNFDRWLGRSSLREFEYRIAFQMGGTDSSNLVDSPAASRLGRNRALLYRDSMGSVEKFRPYGLPDTEWLDEIRQAETASSTPEHGDDPDAPDLNDFQVI